MAGRRESTTAAKRNQQMRSLSSGEVSLQRKSIVWWLLVKPITTLLWLLFIFPGKTLLWFQYMFPKTLGTAIGGARRRNVPVIQVGASLFVYAMLATILVAMIGDKK